MAIKKRDIISVFTLIFSLLFASSSFSATKVVLNEVFYDPAGGTLGQWIELHNITGDELNLSLEPLTLEISSSTSWMSGTALSFVINDLIIAPNSSMLISNSGADLGGGIFADVVLNSDPLFSLPSGIFSARGIRVKLNGSIEDAILFGKVDGSSTNMAALDPTGYYGGGGSVTSVPIVAGAPEGYALTRTNYVDTNMPGDWMVSAVPSPQGGGVFAVPEPGSMMVFCFGMLICKALIRRK